MSEKQFPGAPTPEVQSYEFAHRMLSAEAAADGMVLLKNEQHALPLKKGTKIALYGAGASQTIKGGTGSGDVNVRHVVSIFEGLINAGFEVTTADWIETYDRVYEEARLAWRDRIWKLTDEENMWLFDAYSSTPFLIPSGELPKKTDADTAIYVISRTAGENADRHAVKGDYYLTDDEERAIAELDRLYGTVVLLINTGGVVDLAFSDRYENLKAILLIGQPGMEAGTAAARVLSGEVTPGGKLTDTWAFRYEDYPNAGTFSHCDGDVSRELYHEGIYVGYRYFDTFDVPVRYGFGFGLSYTEFRTELESLTAEKEAFTAKVKVTNAGKTFAGREVVQVYVSCPEEGLAKEYRRLAGFKKTGLLAPGESEIVEIAVSMDRLASYDPAVPGWTLDGGLYGIFVGNSLAEAVFAGSLTLDEDVTLTKTVNVCPLDRELHEMEGPAGLIREMRGAWIAKASGLPQICLFAGNFTTEAVEYGLEDERIPAEARAFAEKLSVEQMVHLCAGDPGESDGQNIGASGRTVAGAAAETHTCAKELGLDSMVLADGPAGLRIRQTYYVKDGAIVPGTFDETVENGFLSRAAEPEGEKRYQFTTAIPVGTVLAQTWDPVLVERLGEMVSEELELYSVSFWLAPGMCIHRNPLCGRNFEYYSEDPLVTGVMAAAMTKGVQRSGRCATTVKHYACNNQEDNRLFSNSVLTERTLREIYLKGFEIAVKEAQPHSLMTSYNRINGIYAANNYDLCTRILRDEWGFEGVVMTDWTTTNCPGCTASGCMRAGNDLVMPGLPGDFVNLRKELDEGTLEVSDLRRSMAHLAAAAKKVGKLK